MIVRLLALIKILVTCSCCVNHFLCCWFVNFSAADEYILRHFDKFFGAQGDASSLLRIFDVDRRIETVSTVVKKYCLLKGLSQFAAPTRDDILKRRVIITTLVTSLTLSELNVKNRFSHIFIDEAAQVRNCFDIEIVI